MRCVESVSLCTGLWATTQRLQRTHFSTGSAAKAAAKPERTMLSWIFECGEVMQSY
jgi:hypothetical protein